MFTTIAEADIKQLGIGAISVGQVGIGPIKIGHLVVSDFELNAAGDGAVLRNFRVIISYDMSIEWRLRLEVPGVAAEDSGTVELGIQNFEVGFGDLKLPGLENLKIKIDSLNVDNIAAAAAPITNLELGKAVAEQIKIQNVKLPTQGFTLAGLGLGALKVGGVGVPAANLDSFKIGRLKGDAFPLGQMSIGNLSLPSASIADIASQGVDVSAVPRPKAFHIDLGCLDLTIKVNPKAAAHIDQLLIHNVSASTSIGKIELRDVVAPYELLNLTLAQLGIDTISVPQVSIA
ncbi:hypothetical protein CU048_15500 [Beijerinckiaceae bacterium]|nr:hypothetical protein CU048_15500 [Beijerinckiaceae bacterium]